MQVNVILVPGSNGTTSWVEWLKETFKETKFNLIVSDFPSDSSENFNYKNWRNVLTELKNVEALNSESIVIAHSLGTNALVKFISETGTNIKGFVSVAGFFAPNRENNIKAGFQIERDDFDNAANRILNRYSMYSDNDHIFTFEQLKSFANLLDSQHIFLENKGHFGNTAKVYELPELVEIVKQIDSVNVKL